MIKNGGNFRIWFIGELEKEGLAYLKCKDYLTWSGQTFEYKVLHHILGSVSKKLRTTDFCIMPLFPEDHDHAGNNMFSNEKVKEYLRVAFINLNAYLAHKKGPSLPLNLDPLLPNNWIELIKEVMKC